MHTPTLRLVLLLCACLCGIHSQATATTQISELHPADFVLLHEPGLEVQLASLHPAGALYEAHGPSRHNATLAHWRFRAALTRFGIRSMTVREVLLNCPHSKLVDLAMNVLRFRLINATNARKRVQHFVSNEYKRAVLEHLPIPELADIIVTRPTVQLLPSSINTHVVTHFTSFSPLGNLVFTRDQQITTAKGVVLGRPNSPQRAAEPRITALCWEHLQVPVIGDVSKVEGAVLEGGDFIPMGLDICYIGVGLRTNMKAIEYLLDQRLFGTQRVAVVRDDFDKDQDRMHLDTVFNVVDSHRVIVLEDILGNSSPKRRLVDVYVLHMGRYVKNVSDIEFGQFLKQEGWQIITVNNTQQLQYMINFVNLGRGLILAVHPDLGRVLGAAGFQGHVEYVDYSGITSMYGAAHCTTQVLRLQTFRTVSPMRYSVPRDPISTAARGILGVGAVLLAAVAIRHSRLHHIFGGYPVPHPAVHPAPPDGTLVRTL